MTIKNILIHLENSLDCDTRLRVAAELARFFDARLSGLYIQPPPAPIDTGMPEFSAADMETYTAQVEDEKQRIEQMLARHGGALPWRTSADHPQQALSDSSRYHDLIIVGKDLKNHNPLGMLSETAADVAVKASCPILALPAGFDGAMPIKRPLVAWNCSREAARAVTDSLPFLQMADDVTVFNGCYRNAMLHDNADHRIDIMRYLSLHNATASYVESQLTGSDNISDALRAQIDDQGHDLIVMGAYGHSQLRELFFGSTTRDLLKSMPLPALLSH